MALRRPSFSEIASRLGGGGTAPVPAGALAWALAETTPGLFGRGAPYAEAADAQGLARRLADAATGWPYLRLAGLDAAGALGTQGLLFVKRREAARERDVFLLWYARSDAPMPALALQEETVAYLMFWELARGVPAMQRQRLHVATGRKGVEARLHDALHPG